MRPPSVSHLTSRSDSATTASLCGLTPVSRRTGGKRTLVDSALTMMHREGGTKNEGRFHGEIGQHVRGGDVDNLPPPEEKVWGGGYFKPGEQWHDYHVTHDGEIFAGYLNCGTTLVDVPEGSGFVSFVSLAAILFFTSRIWRIAAGCVAARSLATPPHACNIGWGPRNKSID